MCQMRLMQENCLRKRQSMPFGFCVCSVATVCSWLMEKADFLKQR